MRVRLGLFGVSEDEEKQVSSATVAVYVSGGLLAVVISSVVIALIPSVPQLLYLAPAGSVALTLFLIYLFAREYAEASEERRRLTTGADEVDPREQDDPRHARRTL